VRHRIGDKAGEDGDVTDTELERQLQELRVAGIAAQTAGQRIDTGRAWRELQLLRSRRTRNRRRGLTVAVAITVAAAIATVVPILMGGLSAGPANGQHSEPTTGPSRRPGPVRMYPGAIVARIPLGGVIMVVGDAEHAWAIRARSPLGASSYQLARIDLRTNKVTLRRDLGKRPELTTRYIRPAGSLIAFGGGAVWLTTSSGQARGQVVRLNPATGKVVSTLHLPAGHCTGLAYAGARLWAGCEVSAKAVDFFRINPATGRVDWRAGPAPEQPGFPGQSGFIAATPRSVWYTSDSSGIHGLIDQGGRARSVTVRDLAFPTSFAYTNELVYGDGAIWAMTTDESIARIDPATGRVTRIYTYRTYDPYYSGLLQILVVGHGSLWLSDGFRVLRVSMATGLPLGGVSAGSASCNQMSCWPYSTPGAIWISTLKLLIRIDPARMPG
jgi:hypothetical protein